MSNKDFINMSPTQLFSGILSEIDSARQDSYDKLLRELTITWGLETEYAKDIANYFFGKNPDIKKLTESLLKDLNITK